VSYAGDFLPYYDASREKEHARSDPAAPATAAIALKSYGDRL